VNSLSERDNLLLLLLYFQKSHTVKHRPQLLLLILGKDGVY